MTYTKSNFYRDDEKSAPVVRLSNDDIRWELRDKMEDGERISSINDKTYNRVLDRLVQEAGRCCVKGGANKVIDLWECIYDQLRTGESVGKNYFIGFGEDDILINGRLEERLRGFNRIGYKFGSAWRLSVNVYSANPESTMGKIVLELIELETPHFWGQEQVEEAQSLNEEIWLMYGRDI